MSLYATSVLHRTCLRVAVEYGAARLSSGTDQSLSVIIWGGSSQHVCVMTAASPSLYVTGDGGELARTNGTQS